MDHGSRAVGGRTSPGRADGLLIVHTRGLDSTCEKYVGRDTAEAITKGGQKQTEYTRFRNGLV